MTSRMYNGEILDTQKNGVLVCGGGWKQNRDRHGLLGLVRTHYYFFRTKTKQAVYGRTIDYHWHKLNFFGFFDPKKFESDIDFGGTIMLDDRDEFLETMANSEGIALEEALNRLEGAEGGGVITETAEKFYLDITRK